VTTDRAGVGGDGLAGLMPPEPSLTEDSAGSNESLTTVLVAGAANLAIAVAKAVAGLLSGSAAMLSEAAHSVADTITEVLLLTAVRRSARPPDHLHPLGHGQAHYFWAFAASLATFVAGAVFSITQGVTTIRSDRETGDYLLSYVVLAIAFVIESVSLARALRQLRSEAAEHDVAPGRLLRRTPDTALKAVTFEDAAALTGLLLAAGGLALEEVTGSPVWDGAASIAIGLLLAVVAVVLGRDNASYLLNRAAPPRVQRQILDELTATPVVREVVTLVTIQLGPRAVLVAAKVDFDDEASAGHVEAAADEVERRLVERVPNVAYVFLDPTPSRRPDPAEGKPPGPGEPL
jgi:cation diffusion facilitator family transporter